MHFYGWKAGLKTGMYYLRTKPAADAIKFTVDAAALAKAKLAKSAIESSENNGNVLNVKLEGGKKTVEVSPEELEELRLAQMVCSLDNKDACLSCGS